MNSQSRGTLLIILSAVSFGLMPVFARFAYQNGVNVESLLFVRFSLASLAIGTLLATARNPSMPSRRQLLTLLGLGGIGYFLQSALYFTALLHVPVSVVSLALYTYPAFVTAFSLILGWEKPSTRLTVALLSALVGLMLLANPLFDVAAIGFLMALGAAVTYTGYILVSTRALKDVSGEMASFIVMAAASLSFGTFGLLTGELNLAWTTEAWLWALMISLVSTAVAVTAFFQGLRLIGPSRASILSVSELVTSLVCAFVVFKESLSILQWTGSLLILTAVVLVALSETTHGGRGVQPRRSR